MKIRLHWGTGIVLVYVAFAAATLAFVTFAIVNPASLVTDHYYRDATRHDERMAAIANAQSVGAGVRVVDEGTTRVALLEASLPHAGRARGTVTWYRASDASADRVVELSMDAAGRQRLSMEDLAAGHWRLKVEWDVDGRPFYLERVVVVR